MLFQAIRFVESVKVGGERQKWKPGWLEKGMASQLASLTKCVTYVGRADASYQVIIEQSPSSNVCRTKICLQPKP